MTDIDALVAEARKLFLIGIAPGGEETMAGRLIDALTTERAKVASLYAEVERLRDGVREGFSFGFQAAWAKVTADQGKAPFFLDDDAIQYAWDLHLEFFEDRAINTLTESGQ
jgi:hypothetical protein